MPPISRSRSSAIARSIESGEVLTSGTVNNRVPFRAFDASARKR